MNLWTTLDGEVMKFRLRATPTTVGLLNIVSKLSQNGVAGFLLANGALSDDGTELKNSSAANRKSSCRSHHYFAEKPVLYNRHQRNALILNKNKKARVVEQNGQLKRYRNREDEILFYGFAADGQSLRKRST